MAYTSMALCNVDIYWLYPNFPGISGELFGLYSSGGEEISSVTIGWIGLGVLFVLLFLGMPVGFVMGFIGFAGYAYLVGINGGFANLGQVPFDTVFNYSLSVVPLFVLMGTFCFYAGISSDLYNAAYKWVGQLPGGLAMATIGACAVFSSVSGSSVACAATIGKVSYPEMKKYSYDPALSTGSIAAGGTLDIMIPPSVMMILYGIITGTSISKLFLAGFIPGILEAVFYIAVIYVMCKRNPLYGPKGPATTFIEKLVSLKGVWMTLVLFVIVIGGMYVGVFTPTEAGGIGAFGAFLITAARGKLSWQNFWASITDSTGTVAMIFPIIVGAMFFNYFLAVTRLPTELAAFLVALPVDRYITLTAILVLYILLGAVMDELGMVLLTVPIFYPVILALGFDPIWFGIIIIMMCVFGMLAPPVGMIVYVVTGVVKDVPMSTIYKGILPFFISDLVVVVLLVAFPQIVLFVPALMK